MTKVHLPDGTIKEYDRRVRPIDIAMEIGPRLAKATIAAEVDGQIVGADTYLPEDGEVHLRLITTRDAAALNVMRHSCAHVMARAVMRLFDGVQLAFGPTVENGFYYDFQIERAALRGGFSGDRGRDGQDRQGGRAVRAGRDGPRRRPSSSAATWARRSRSSTSKTGLADHGRVSFYRQGEFIDLCRGPHVPARRRDRGLQAALASPGPIGRAMPTGSSCSGSTAPPGSTRRTWTTTSSRSKRPSAATIACWASSSSCSPSTRWSAPGLVLWLPKGAVVRRQLENFLNDELIRRGYQPVYTPHIGRIELVPDLRPLSVLRRQPVPADLLPSAGRRRAGLLHFGQGEIDDDASRALTVHHSATHLASARTYRTTTRSVGEGEVSAIESWLEKQERYLLKPMNCPHHIKIYKSKPRSYRELPVRLAEFGTVYRFEQSGELNGMTRVRGFTQDDAHIFCTEEQVADEFRGCIEMTQFVLEDAGPDRLPRAAGLPRSGQRQVRRQRRELAAGRGGPGSGLPRDEPAEPARSSGARRRSTGRRPTSWSPTASAASGSWAPCSSTTTCPARSGSAWNTSAPTTTRTSR